MELKIKTYEELTENDVIKKYEELHEKKLMRFLYYNAPEISKLFKRTKFKNQNIKKLNNKKGGNYEM